MKMILIYVNDINVVYSSSYNMVSLSSWIIGEPLWLNIIRTILILIVIVFFPLLYIIMGICSLYLNRKMTPKTKTILIPSDQRTVYMVTTSQ